MVLAMLLVMLLVGIPEADCVSRAHSIGLALDTLARFGGGSR